MAPGTQTGSTSKLLTWVRINWRRTKRSLVQVQQHCMLGTAATGWDSLIHTCSWWRAPSCILCFLSCDRPSPPSISAARAPLCCPPRAALSGAVLCCDFRYCLWFISLLLSSAPDSVRRGENQRDGDTTSDMRHSNNCEGAHQSHANGEGSVVRMHQTCIPTYRLIAVMKRTRRSDTLTSHHRLPASTFTSRVLAPKACKACLLEDNQ